MSDTILSVVRDDDGISIHFPPGSARSIRAQIDQAYAGDLRRTVNGDLIDLTRPTLRRYTASLSSDGLSFPDLRRVWRGARVTVALPVLWTAHAVAGAASIVLERPAAMWALRHATTGFEIAGATINAARKTVTLPAGCPACVLEYQPELICRVATVSMSGDEWQAGASWTLDLEEI